MPAEQDTAGGELVRHATEGQVATITLDSPPNRNALSAALLTQLDAALDQALGDASVRVVVLTGAGPAFCSGADLREAAAGRGAAPALLGPILGRIWDSGKPVVCRANGPARAGGIGLIAACDIALAPLSATFAFSEVRIGVAPAVIAVTCLRRMTARSAAEYFLTGATFDARRAAEIGLITRAVPDAELDTATLGCVEGLLRGAPGALAATKSILREVPALPLAEGLDRMAALSAKRFACAEAQEGMAAFTARRDPSWVSTG
jgi:methylglutaconyl-CoA hydratase